MKTILKIEWLRFVRNPVNLWTLSLLFVLLALTAVLSGLAASQVRERQAETRQAWLKAQGSQQQSASQSAGVDDHGNPLRPGSDAMATSQKLPAVSVLQPRGGLVLGVQAFAVLPSEIKSGLRARYTDGRNSEPLENPLLQSLGALDLAAMTVLLLPLALIILAFGLLHEERERGIWRQVCTLTARPWQLLAAALLVRAGAVLLTAWLATAIGFALDSAASWSAFLQWGLGLALLSLSWGAIAGLFSLTRLSSAGSGAALVGTWLLLSFALPALLTTWAHGQHPGPSKLGLIVDMRQAQESMGAQRDALLTQWYEQNPMHAQPAWKDGKPPGMLPFVTVGLAQDKLMRPLAQAFDQARAQRWASLHAWAWVAPGLPLLLQADQLAGADAERYAGFIEAVNRHEDHWRAFVLPRVMTAAPLSVQDVQALPAPLAWTGNAADRGGVASALLPPLAPLALWLAFWLARKRARQP